MYNYVCGEEITTFSWENPSMNYYIVYNKYMPHFRPQVMIQDLVEKAKTEYELPGITLNLTFAGMLYTNRRQNFDGKNTISFSPDVTAAETHFYVKNILQREEFDMKLNSRVYLTPETLYLSILHEFGHIFGLDHPLNSEDSIMGKGLIKKTDGTFIQEYKYYTLTKSDVIGLYKHESIFRSRTQYQRQFLNSVLFSILSSYPSSIVIQNYDCVRSMNMFREGNDVDELLDNSLEEYYSKISLI